jgi:hypothetical protein
MTPEERERLDWLCTRIQEEQDPKIFDNLIRALSELLERKHECFRPEHKTNRLA